MAFRLVRLSTGDDGQSHVTTGGWRLVDDQPWRRLYIAF
jgi:hypothetical protein